MLVPISNNFSRLLEEKQNKENRFIPLADVARDAKISRKTLYKWEKNILDRFDADTVEKLCKYFGVGLSELLEMAPSDLPPKKKK